MYIYNGCTEYEQLVCSHIGLDEQGFQSKIVNIFLPTVLTCVLGAQRNRLIEMVLLRPTTYVLVEK